MGVIFNEAEAVWEWLMTHLIVINLLFSIIIIFFPAQRSQIGMDLAVCSELYSGVRNYILSSFRPGFKKEPDV